MKARTVICVIAALIIFSGASPWEGAAAVAPEGELPATGRYVATNSFPANTIVDITNIENNRSTRVIVANNLNSPGLLAIVSLEAAELIGMRPGSVSRIRMVQPSDPIAYLRFTEGVNAGFPEYNGNARSEDELHYEIYGGDTYRPPSFDSSGGTAQADVLRGPSYTLEPEWSGRPIIDLPGYVDYPPLNGTETAPPPVEETPPAPVQVTEQRTEPPVETAIATEQSQREVIKDPSVYTPITAREEVDKDIPNYFTEVPREEVEKNIPEYIAEVPREEVDKDIPEIIENAPGQTEYSLVSTTDQPPPPDTIYGIDPADIIPSLPTAPPAQETVRPPAVADTAPDRILPYLERGWYYVQIASADSLESAENIIRQIDSRYEINRYEPKVYKDSNNRFCVLLKPMNQGESAAVLQRFRSIGYRDAFVRHVS